MLLYAIISCYFISLPIALRTLSAFSALCTQEKADMMARRHQVSLLSGQLDHTLRTASIATAMIWSDNFTNFTAMCMPRCTHSIYIVAQIITHTITSQTQLRNYHHRHNCKYSAIIVAALPSTLFHFDKSISFCKKVCNTPQNVLNMEK